MKQKPFRNHARAIRICALPFAALFAVSASAANVSWNGAADAVWSTGGNWVGGVAPVATDVAVFDAGSSANLTTALGADFSIAGLKITTPGGLITIGAGNLLTLGAGGIDMSAASQNLLLEALVALAADQSWNVANGRTLTASGIISGTNVNLNKIGFGDLILGGANTFTGITTIGGGTLTLNGSLNGTAGTDLTFAGTGTFNVSAASGVSQGMKVLRFSGGDGTVRSTNSGGTSTVSFTSRAVRAAGATGNFVISGGTAGTPGSPGTLGTNNITIGGELTAQLLDRGLFYNGSQYAAYDAGGFVRGLIYGMDTNAPATIATAATLGVDDATQNVEISGNITAQTTASVNTIRDPGAFSITLAGGQTLSFNSILKAGGNAATISGGSGITTTASENEMVIRTDTAGDTLTISTPILANGASSLTKSGAGTLVLSAANTYTGYTSINAGVLNIRNGTAMGTVAGGVVVSSGAALQIQNGITVGNEPLTINGTGVSNDGALRSISGNNIYGGLLTLGSSVRINSDTNGNTLTLSNAGTITGSTFDISVGGVGNTTISSVIGTTTGMLTKDGSGMLTLSGANTYSGGTNLNAGTLRFGNTQAIGSGALVIVGGALDSTVVNLINANNNLQNWNGDFSFTGTQNLNLGTGAVTMSASRTVTINANTLTVGGSIPGSGLGLTKAGVGVLTLSGANTYTGETKITGGVLRLDHATGLPGGIGVTGGTSALTFNGGVLGLGVGDYARGLNTAGTANAANFTGAGGWAAYGADRLVNLGGAAATINWSAADTGFNGQTLILSAATATHTLDLQNPLDLGSTLRTVQVDNGSAVVDAIVSGSLSGAGGGLIKTGLGTLVLSNTGNSYTGATMVSAGTLRISASNVISNASNITVGGTGTAIFDLNGNSNTIGSLTFAGSTATVSTGVGTLTLGGDVTYIATGNPGVATISGKLELGANRIFNINDSTGANPDMTVSAVISGSGFSLTKVGGGTLDLSGANTYSGTTVIGGGILNAKGSLNGTTGTDLTFTASGTFNVNEASGVSQGMKVLRFNGGDGLVKSTNSGGTSTLNFASRAARAAGATGNFALTNGTVGTPGNPGTLGTNNIAITGETTGQIMDRGLFYNGSSYAAYDAGGFVRGLIYGGTDANAPAAIGTGAALGVDDATQNVQITGSITAQTTAAVNTIKDSGAFNITLADGQTLRLNGILKSGGDAATISGGTGITTTASGGEMVIRTDAAGDTLTIGTPILASGNSSLTKSGAGTLVFTANNTFTGALAINDGTLTLKNDGSGNGFGNGQVQRINFGNNVTISGNTTINVDRLTASAAGILLNAQNKIFQFGTLGIGARTLTVNNSNGFGLEFTGTTTLSGATNFAVNGGNNAPVVQGLTLSGKVSGAFGFTKSNGGTLVLANATNDFGSASTISVTGGLLSVGADGALGAVNNIISLSGGGLQANGTFITARQINTTGASTIDVTQGTVGDSLNVFTLTTPFNNGVASANALTKNGNGIFEINANNNGATPYTGVITINAGAIRVSNAGALGAAANNTVVANNIGAAVQINGVSMAELFNISNSGINSGGAIENFAGTSELTGLITLGAAATIGSTSGTLNIKGGIVAGTNALSFSGAGNITISNTAITGTTSTLTKIGSGTVEIQNANPLTGNITVNAGTLKLNVAGTTAGNLTIAPDGVLTLDNSGTDVANRLSGKTLGLSGATVNFVGSALAEAVGVLTVNAGLTTINLSGAGGTLSFDSLASRAAGGAVSISSSGSSSVQFATNAPALVPAAVGIIPGFFFGNDFATHSGAATPITAYSSYVTGDLAAVVTNETVKPTGAQSSVNSMLINALNLTAGVGVTINLGQTLTLDAGALIYNGGGSITGGVLTTSGNAELIANYATDGSISSNISSTTGGLTKIGAGNLTLASRMGYSGQTTINQGVLTLGVNQALSVGNPLVVNKGGTLDLGSGSQYVGSLTSTGTVENSGGIIIGTGGTLTVNQTTNGTFAGSIQGSLNLVKAGDRTLTLTSANTTTGTVSIIGGLGSLRERNEPSGDLGRGLTLKDGGSLPNVSAITVRGATLNLDNSGHIANTNAGHLAASPLSTKDMADRINDLAPITLDNGTIRFVGRSQLNSTETIGPVTVSGFSSITMITGGNTQGGTGVNSATLTLTSLTRNPGAMIQFNRGGGVNTPLGVIGNRPRVLIKNDDISGLTIVNGTVVGMASYVDNDKYFPVSYVPGLGFGNIGQAGFPNNYMSGANGNGFTGQNTLALATSTNDFNTGESQIVRAGGQTVNSLGFQGAGQGGNYANTIKPVTFQAEADTLTIASGWLALWFRANQIGDTVTRGAITSGQSELFLFGGYLGALGSDNFNRIHSVVKDNGANSVKFVMSLGRDTYLTANNTYTGGTVVNAELALDGGGPYFNNLYLNGSPGFLTIPNATNPADGLVITSAAVTMQVNEGQIGSNNIVTLNGGATLNLVGNNTLAGIVFNSNAGTVTPTITPNGTLKITGDITSTPTNAIVTPRINGGNLDLNGNSSHTITVGAMPQGDYVNNSSGVLTPQIGLDILSVIQNGGFTKEGAGILRISGANTYDRDTIINAGTLLLGAANVIPDGAGKGNVTLNGTLNLNSFTETINGLSGAASGVVDNLSGGGIYTLTFGGNNAGGLFAGTIKNTAGIVAVTKIGSGTQILSGSNSYAGQTAVTQGVLDFQTPSALYGGDASKWVKANISVNAGATLAVGVGGVGHFTSADVDTLLNGSHLGASDSFSGLLNGASIGFDTTGSNFTYGTAISNLNGGANVLGLVKLGAGTLELTGANAYSGETVVREGTLALAGAPTASGGVTVSGGTLKLDYSSNNVTKIADGALLTLGGGTLDLTDGSHVEVVGSTTIAAGASNVTRSSGTAVLRLNALTRNAGGTVNFSDDDIASTSTANDVSGILGAWATVGGVDLATNSGVSEGAGNNFIRAYTGYTDIAARGATVPGGLTSNVRINSAGTSGNNVLSAPTTAINTLMQNTGTASTLALVGGTLRVNGILLNVTGENLTVGSVANDGTVTSAASSGVPDVTLNNTSASKVLTINAVIADNTVASTLSKFGAGTAILAGANTYTGSTAVNAGVLQIGNGGATGSLGSGSVVNDASLVFNRGDALTVSNGISGSGTLTQNGAGTLTLAANNTYAGVTNINAGALQIGNGGTVGSLGAGGVINNASLIFNRSDALTFSGVISGNGSVAQSGSGTLVLSAANTYTGATSINAGTLSIASNASLGAIATAAPLNINGGTLLTTATFTMDNAGSNKRGIIIGGSGATISNNSATQLTVSGVVSGAGSLTKIGIGTTLLSGANTYSGDTIVKSGALVIAGAPTGSGATTITGGTLKLDYTTSNVTKLADGAQLTLGGGTLEIAGGSHVEVVGSTTIATGASTVTRNGGTSVLRMNAITKNAGGVLNFTSSNIASTSTPNDASGILGIWATVGGTDWATNSGVAEGGGNNFITAYTGYTDIAAKGATLSAASNVRINSAGSGGDNVMSAPTTAINTLMQNVGTASTLALAGGTFRVNGIVINATGESLTIGSTANDGTMTSGESSGTPDVTLINNSANKTLTINALIADNTVASTLTKSGGGTVVLAGTNTYTGGTTNGAGILQVGTGGAAGSLGSGNVSNNGSLIFNRSDALSVSSVISGSGTLTQSGTGTLTLTNANTYTGATILSAGTVSVGADSNLGNANTLIFNGGTLQITGTELTSYAAGAIGSHPVTLTAGKTVGFDIVNAANIFTVNQNLTHGSGGLTKVGAGKLILSGTNTFTGAVTLSAGTLSVGADANLGNGNALVFNGGTLQITGTALTSYAAGVIGTHAVTLTPDKTVGFDIASAANTFTVDQILNQGTGGLTKLGAGALILSGANSYTGLTTVNEGTLIVNGTISGSTEVNSGGTLTGSNSTGTMGSVTVKSGGIFTPGVNGIGEMNIGTLGFEAGSVFEFQINTTDSQIDFVNVTGDLNIASGAVLNASDLASAALPEGSGVPAIIDYSGAWNGGVFKIMEGATLRDLGDDSVFTIGLNAYQISYNGVDGASSEVTLTVTAVPEPGAAVSLLGGLGLLLGVRRRRA